MTPLFGSRVTPDHLKEAAWVARCVGDSQTAPLQEADLTALASYMRAEDYERGAPVAHAGQSPAAICIVRNGLGELVAGSGSQRLVIRLLRPGDVDGDIQLLLGMEMPYTIRAIEPMRCLIIDPDAFDRLLRDHPAIARRWLSSVAMRVGGAQTRIVQLLGRSLSAQLARLLLDEAADDTVPLPQKTLAAMLGAQRPSVNRALRRFQRSGYVRLSYAAVHLADRQALEKVAGGG